MAITWTGGNALSCFLPFIFEEMKSALYIFIGGAIIGIPFIFWTLSRLNNVNQEIERLEKKKKELRNSIR